MESQPNYDSEEQHDEVINKDKFESGAELSEQASAFEPQSFTDLKEEQLPLPAEKLELPPEELDEEWYPPDEVDRERILETSLITVVLDLDLNQFTKDKEDLLLNAIAELANVNRSAVRVTGIEFGSLHITIEVLGIKLDLLLEKINKDKLGQQLDTQLPIMDVIQAQTGPNQQYTILFLASQPSDTYRLQLFDESRAIDDELQRSPERENFRLVLCPNIRVRDLTLKMRKQECTIVHFAGHGTPDGFCFEDELGKSYIASIESVANFFSKFADNVQCVVLNVCYSGRQADTITQHIDYVIGIRDEIENKFAIIFSIGFYRALGEGLSFVEAYESGLLQMGLEGYCNAEKPFLTGKKVKAI